MTLKKISLLFLGAGLVVFSAVVCSPENSVQRGSYRRSSTASSGDRENSPSRGGEDYCLADLPQCDEGNCCGDDSRDCRSECKNYFTNDSDEQKCLDLPREDGEKVVEILKYLEEAHFGKVGVGDENLKYLCLSVSGIGQEAWLDIISEYTPSEAREALKWLAENQEVIRLFHEWESSITEELLSALFVKAGGGNFNTDEVNDISAQLILEGLKSAKSDFYTTAIQEDGNLIVDFVHRRIIRKNICEVESHQPRPGSGYSGYNRFSPNPNDGVDPTSPNGQALRRRETACILSVYCEIFDGESASHNKNRREIAGIVDEYAIDRFMKDNKSSGGLEVDTNSGRSLHEWPYAACQALCQLWFPVPGLQLSKTGNPQVCPVN